MIGHLFSNVLPMVVLLFDSINSCSVDYDVIFAFGLTEFKAFTAWKENVGLLVFWCVARTNKICRRISLQGIEKR